MNSYWSDETHGKWETHYVEGRFRNQNGLYSQFLAFTSEWAKNLPAGGYGLNPLECTLLDTQSGLTYTTPMYAAYEDNYILNENLHSVKCMTLMSYFYEEHHCSCHRHADAVTGGLNENMDNFECEGYRFLIQSIKVPASDLILMSETIMVEELENLLKAKQI